MQILCRLYVHTSGLLVQHLVVISNEYSENKVILNPVALEGSKRMDDMLVSSRSDNKYMRNKNIFCILKLILIHI